MSAPVFFIGEPGTLADDAAREAMPGTQVTVTGPEARHAVVVQRIRVGQDVDLVDGRGTRISGQVAAVTAGQRPVLEVVVGAVTAEPQPAWTVTLVQALAKGDRDELAVEAATELGVDEIVPWQAERSVSVWKGEKLSKGAARWRATVVAACKQSRRAWLPPVAELVTTAALSRLVAERVAAGATVLVLHEAATAGIVATVQAAVAAGRSPQTAAAGAAPSRGAVVLVVGPEGGISDDEVAVLLRAGASAVVLGSSVLRTSTAGPAALAALSPMLGRWS